MFSGYIPTQNLLGLEGMELWQGVEVAQFVVEPFNLVGEPYAVKGIEQFRMQHNPSSIKDSEAIANYAEHRGLGSRQATLHYTYSDDMRPFDIPFVIDDTYEGPPHATTDTSGNIVFNDFGDLFDVVSWFKNLTHPIEDWRHPPYVRVSFGRWSRYGVVTNVAQPNFVKFYRNGDPMIVEMSFTLRPTTFDIGGQKAFYEVSK